MILTHHAAQRWAERCAGLDLAHELSRLRRPSKKIRELLSSSWARNQGPDFDTSSRCYLLTASGVVLVVGEENVVVTVLLVADVKRWERRRKRERRNIDRGYCAVR